MINNDSVHTHIVNYWDRTNEYVLWIGKSTKSLHKIDFISSNVCLSATSNMFEFMMQTTFSAIQNYQLKFSQHSSKHKFL